jgi:hypothetical protein
MKKYAITCLALHLSFAAQAQINVDKNPLTPIYAALQSAAPAPAMRPIPAALTNACNPKAGEIADVVAFDSGTVHYMLDRLYVWHTYKQLDGSLCAWLDAPSGQLLTRNDVQALETVSWLKTPQKPSASIGSDNIPPGPVARSIALDFVRSYSRQPCEADVAPTANVTMITNNVGFTTADIAGQSGLNEGCVYAPVFGATPPDSTLRRIDVVRKSSGAVITGIGELAFVEIQEAANVPLPPFHFDGGVQPLRPANGTFGNAIFNTFASAVPAYGEFFSRSGLPGNLHLSYLQSANPLLNCPGLVAPNYFGGAFVDDDNVLGVITGTAAECQNGGTFVPASAKYRFDGMRLGASEFAKFLAFEAAAQPALAIRLLQPKELTTIDVALASTQLGCNGPNVTSEIAWRSSLISPVTGTNEVGTGCYIPANKLARGTQMLTVYRSTDPRRKSSVKINAIKSEATLSLSRTGEYILPGGNFSLNLNISWSSQDVGSHVLLTEQLDTGPEVLISDALYGNTSTQIGVNHLATYRLRRATPNFALTGGVLDENAVTVLAAPVVPLQTPTKVTYPFQAFRLRTPAPPFPTYDCPTGVCTFVLKWLSDGSFGVVNEIKQRRLNYCNSFAPYECVFEPWIDLPNTSGSSRVITFNARFGQTDQFEFKIRACAPFRGCSGWSAPTTTIEETLYRGSISASPASGSWTVQTSPPPAPGWPPGVNCTTIPESIRPTLTIRHDYPFSSILMEGAKPPNVDGSVTIPPETTVTLRLSSFSVEPQRGSFSLSMSTPLLAQLNLNPSYVTSGDGLSALCKYGPL